MRCAAKFDMQHSRNFFEHCTTFLCSNFPAFHPSNITNACVYSSKKIAFVIYVSSSSNINISKSFIGKTKHHITRYTSILSTIPIWYFLICQFITFFKDFCDYFLFFIIFFFLKEYRPRHPNLDSHSIVRV